MSTTATTTPNVRPGDAGRPENGIRRRFALRSDGTDWANRDDPRPDAASLLRPGSPRCLCNNGCRQVFAGGSTHDRHLVMRDDGSAVCRTPAELRGMKRPMFRDVAGVWHSGQKGGDDGD